MGFGQEMKDFVEGYKTGEDIRDARAKRDLDQSRYGHPSEADIANQPGGSLAGAAPAIPEAGSGGEGAPGDPRYRDAISSIESGGNYKAMGPVVNRTGDRAIGRYQVMASNVPAWTKQALGKEMTVEDFLADPASQDKVFDHIFGGYISKYGERGAAEAWFGGPGSVGKGSRKDKLGTTVKGYGDRFLSALAKAPKPDTTQTAATPAAAPAAPAKDPADFAEKLPTGEEGKGEQQARLSPEAGVAIPEIQTASIQPSFVAPEDEWGQKPVFAASGGVIPEPQFFQDGGAPLPPQPVVPDPNPNNPSNIAGGGDKYSRFRNYTQQITAPTPSATTARRVSFPTAPAPAQAGPSSSQLAFRALQAKNAAVAPAPVAAAPAPVAAKPVAAARPRSVPMSVVMPYGNQGGAFGYYDPTLGSRIKAGKQKFADGGMIPEPEQFARGGAVDPDAHFKELIRQESRQRSQHSDDGGESPRDRAARRISAEKGKASSTAYKMHDKYWQPAKPKKAGPKKGGGPDKVETSSTTPHVRHPPNPKVGKPEIEEDRKTRFRVGDLPAEEDRATRFRPGEGAIPMPDKLAGLPIELQDQNAAPDPRLVGTPRELQDQIPQAAGTPTSGYEPPTGNFPPRPPIPIVQQSGTPRQRYDEEVRQSVPSLTTPQPALPEPPEGPAQPRPAPAPAPRPADPERTARDVGQRRKEMELVTTPPPANRLVPVLLNPETGELHNPAPDDGEYPDVPPQDWSGVNDRRAGMRDTIARSVLNPTGERLFGYEPIPERFGYAEGGMIPEPGQPGYNEAVGRANAAPAAAAQPAPVQERHQPTPQLLSDVATALHHGAQFLTRHFGLAQDGAVPTPEGQQATQDGARRFAEGEGATTPQEIQAIDDKIDPQREMSESDRQMTRSAKIVQWYLERGRKDDAGAAAAGLMQYGAQRFGQIGSIAAAAYRKGDLQGTINALKSAYQMIPDGGAMDVEIDPKTHQLVATHTDEEGNEKQIPIKPGDLPGIIKSVQDKSAYWQQVMTLADPEGVHLKQREEASRSEWNRQHGIERGEKLTDAEAAAKAEAAKNDRERQETIDTEGRAAKRKEIEDAAKQEEGKAKEARDAAEHDRQALLAAGIARAQKVAEGDTTLDSAKLGTLTGAVYAANNAEDADTDEGKQRINEAYSRLQDALPQTDVAKRTELFKKLTNETAPTDFQYIPAGKFLEATGDTPPADYPDKQAGDQVKKGTDPNTGKPIWVIIRDGKQFGVPTS